MRTPDNGSPAWVTADVGFAANGGGTGIAYADVAGRGPTRLLRVPFRVAARGAQDRVVGYAALTAIARALRRWHVERVRFAIDDPALVADLGSHREVPGSLVMPYVHLRCALNQLAEVDIVEATENDLTQRARAEVAMNVAA
ncbi:MAG TPA: hypothetical protein VGF18_09085 [Candidatus Tumulicola sp.]|jgi:hypothetical protein